MKDLVVGVVGGGVVGRATARTYLEHVREVRVYDQVKERSTHRVTDVLKSDIIFICLPTPKSQDSLACDTSTIFNFFQTAREYNPFGRYVLRSTVPIGTTRHLAEKYQLPNLVHSPEFLTARCSLTDALIPSRNIIGFPIENRCGDLLGDLYQNRFPSVPLYEMSSDESEACKLFLNGFFATKVSYFNEVRHLADKLGLDWERVMDGILSDGRITHSHTQVPGPDGRRGFGGSCLPKDLSSLVYQIVAAGLDASVTNAARLRNINDRMPLE